MRIDKELSQPASERDEELLKQMQFLKVCAVVSMSDNNELGYITKARRDAIEMDAIESFKKDFNYEKPESGVAILCVCDRLLTGFDAPIEQAMYLDKNLREHDLMQAIARVNRTKVMKSGYVKEHGIVVDYFGVASHLKAALAIYTATDEKEFEDLSVYFRGLDKEIPVLESRFRRLLQLFQDYGIKQIEQFVQQKMVDEEEEWELVENCVALGAEVKFRAQFDTCIKAFFDSLDLLFNASMAKEYYVAAKRMGYLLMRMRDRYKDETLDLKWAGAKVRKLIDKYLESKGINPRIPPVMLLSDNFPKTLEAHNKSGKARASEMEHAIRWHIKVNMDKDPVLYTLFKEFYRKRGYKFIPPRANKYASMMGLTIDEIAVLELKSRWASCSDKRRKVNFHWKVMMAPASVIDYLIVHELCHFNHKRHNGEFWNEVDKYYPEYQKQVAWLKVYGAALEV